MAAPFPSVGGLDQVVAWQVNQVPPATAGSVTAATVNGQRIATAITVGAHAFLSGDEVTISGANEPEFNGRVIVTVVDAGTLTYRVAPTAPAVATGTITLTYFGDGSGGHRDAWATVETLAAEVRPLTGNERLQAYAVVSAVVYRVRIWRCGILAEHRLVWDGLTLQILAVLRDGGNPYLVLDCIEGRP